MSWENLNLGLGTLPLLSGAKTRSISAENPEGRPGVGGKAASNLGIGRKGRPCLRGIAAGATVTLAQVDGPAIIQHIWLTVDDQTAAGNYVLRDLVLRMYWDDEITPSVETPLGDFFCNGHARRCNIMGQPIVVNPTGGYNSYWPMPFQKSARITLENQHAGPIPELFYQITYSLLPQWPQPEMAYFHAQWRRANPIQAGQDMILLEAEGAGHYAGTYLAWTQLGSSFWWGEGEVKFYIDDDSEWPTICGTGTEDYVGGAWCFGETYSTAYLGYPFFHQEEGLPPLHGLYRFHILDPIRFEQRLRVTVQDIGHNGEALFERTDDVSSLVYWYQREPHAVFPLLLPPAARWPLE